LLNSLELLNDGIKLFTERCIKGITVNSEKMLLNLESSQALSAVLINKIGYDKAADIAKRAANEKKSVNEIAVDEGIFSKEEAEDFFSIGKMTRPNRD
jgi:aspartate ammonia-lyase